MFWNKEDSPTCKNCKYWTRDTGKLYSSYNEYTKETYVSSVRDGSPETTSLTPEIFVKDIFSGFGKCGQGKIMNQGHVAKGYIEKDHHGFPHTKYNDEAAMLNYYDEC